MAICWDRAAALDRVGGDTALLAELISIFFEDYSTHLAALNESLEQEDYAGLRKTAHTLKGSLGYLGANDAMALAVEIERASLGSNPGQVFDLVPRLTAHIESVRPLMLSFTEEVADARSA